MGLLAPGRNLDLAIIEALGPLGSPASQVTLMPLRPHDFARACQAKPFGRGFVSLDLWH